jgi:RNA-binding protein
MGLSGKQRRYLRSLGHNLSAVVQVGKEGISPDLVAALDQALLDHELIKVRLGQGLPLDRDSAAEKLAAASRSEVAQILGSTVLLYRAHPEKPKLKLPARADAAGPGGDSGSEPTA